MQNFVVENKQMTIVLLSRMQNKPFPNLSDVRRLFGVKNAKFYKSSGKFFIYVERLFLIYKVAFEPLIDKLESIYRLKNECTDILLFESNVKCNPFAVLEFDGVFLDGFNIVNSSYDEFSEIFMRYHVSLIARSEVKTWCNNVRSNISIFESRNMFDSSVRDFNLLELEHLEKTYGMKALLDSKNEIELWVDKHTWRNFG